MTEYKVAWFLKPVLGIIDSIGSVLFFWTKMKKRPTHIKKILLIRVEHIGDVLLATPAFHALREKYPDSQIDVLVRSFSKNILEGNDDAHAIVCDTPWLAKNGSWSDIFNIIPRLRKENYDVVVDMHGDPRNILLAKLIGGYSIGFGTHGFGFLLNKEVSWSETIQHTIEHDFDLVRTLGADSKDKHMRLALSKKDVSFADSFFRRNHIQKAVCINPGAGRKAKLWNNQSWADVADHCAGKGFTILITGSKAEQKDAEEILDAMDHKNKVFSLCGKTTLKELAAIIKKCKLFVSPDTGPMHIARAMGTKLVALFGPENPKMWGYNDTNAISIKTNDIKNYKSGLMIHIIDRFIRH